MYTVCSTFAICSFGDEGTGRFRPVPGTTTEAPQSLLLKPAGALEPAGRARSDAVRGGAATYDENQWWPQFRPQNAGMNREERSWTEKGDGPGRCERGDRGHDRDRAFRQKGSASIYHALRLGIKLL